MRLALIRADERFSADRQAAVLTAKRRYTDRDALLKALRKGDELEVSDFHRLASGMKDWRDVWTALGEKNVVVVEARTGFRSDKQTQFSDMLHRATLFWARKDSDTMSEIGKKGAENSPRAKRRKGRMPLREAERILNDPAYETRAAGLAAINSDPRYSIPWSRAFAYRMNDKGEIALRPRLSGYARKHQH